MSEEIKEEKKSKKWYGWVKNVISAVAGAVISCAATIGIIGTNDADIAKQRIDSWMQKADVVYVQIETVTDTIAEVKVLIEQKEWVKALAKLDTIKDSALTTINAIKELREEIAEAAKAVGDEAKETIDGVKEKVKEVEDSVKDGVQDIKDAIDAKPQD